jgi:N-acetylmuramoyl-L-alanine amidase
MGGALTPRWLVMHYTAGGSASESINWLCNPAAKASAHLVIARDGTVTQLVPFNRVAWRAGLSEWKGVENMNRHSIGIELDNHGFLGTVAPQGGWRFRDVAPVAYPHVLMATHKAGKPRGGWHTYTDAQMRAATEVARLLVHTYGLEDVIGHDDIAPGRKTDPGPAFGMEVFKAEVMRDVWSGAKGRRYRVTETLNVRSGPGTEYGKVWGGPLASGALVREAGPPNGHRPWVRIMLPAGYVHGAYLELAAPSPKESV